MIVTEAAAPNQSLHLSGAATPVSRDTKLLQRMKPVTRKLVFRVTPSSSRQRVLRLIGRP